MNITVNPHCSIAFKKGQTEDKQRPKRKLDDYNLNKYDCINTHIHLLSDLFIL